MPKLNAIIFDVDGTLAETERDGHRVAFNGALKISHLGEADNPMEMLDGDQASQLPAGCQYINVEALQALIV